MRRTRKKKQAWSWTMRFCALFMALNLFMLPQLTTGKAIITVCEETGTSLPSLLEEEVKHACDIRKDVRPVVHAVGEVILLHQFEQRMLEHPLMEVPHQPPK